MHLRSLVRPVCWFLGHHWEWGGLTEDERQHTISWKLCSRCGALDMWELPRFENYGAGYDLREIFGQDGLPSP